MPMQITSSYVVFEAPTIALAAFAGLVERHLNAVPETRDLEFEGARLKAEGFSEPDLVRFIQRVCRWGGYAGLASRIVNHNPTAAIRRQFFSAAGMLDKSPPDVQGALQKINSIRHLGQPSFASKHLRFLRPDVCPILDSIIARRLQYKHDTYGYWQFSQDCLKIAQALEAKGIANPMDREAGRWFAADVEMALFAHLYGL
jgi:hypothetical protein